jgi:ferredoxin
MIIQMARQENIEKMKAVIDKSLCIGCGICPETCPEVFESDEDGLAHVKVESVPAEAEQPCREAADQCPVTAITIGE